MHTSGFRIDHVVIFVGDLDEAVEDYSALGFKVTSGGTHAGGVTKNALIPLADGSYLELLAFTIPSIFQDVARLEKTDMLPWVVRKRTALDRRFIPRAGGGEGLADFALAAVSIGAVIQSAGRGGIEVDGPFPGERVRPDGTTLAWRMAMPTDRELPFLIEDMTPREFRVPGGDAVEHPNGALGMRRLVVATTDVEGSSRRYSALLGDPTEEGSLTWQLEGVVLCLTSSEGAGEAADLAGRHRIQKLELAVADAASSGALEESKAHGAVIELGGQVRREK
jgi:catechol 2,3-dioxygenase-like lactoylglutathione lyase family enzyme